MSFSDKAEAMYETAMENVKDQVDTAYKHAEDLAMLIGKVEDEDLRDKLDEELSNVMNTLLKI